MEASPQRKESVDKARENWIHKLIDLSRRNNLLYFRPLKVGTLDLSLADGDAISRLVKGEAVSFAELLGDPIPVGLPNQLTQIWRRAQSNAEEKGLSTLFVTQGMATWKAPDEGRDTESPVLLLPVALESKGRAGISFSLRPTGPVQVNLVLLHVLDTEFRVKVTAEELLLLLQGDNEVETFDPAAVYGHLTSKCSQVPGFQVKNSSILGNFAFQKMAMVNDLRDHGEELVAHEIVAALAGDMNARQVVGAPAGDTDPREFDRVLPQTEFLILDADSSQQRSIAAVLSGQSAVIHGPPGTGKSQTIANLIASLAAAGQRVLFVAEKRAALEVVQKRLKQVGLENIAIDLHGADVSPKRVIEQVASALDSLKKSPPVDCEQMHQRFVDRRERLNRHVDRMHRKRQPSGKTVYELQGLVLKLEKESKADTRWRGPELEKVQKAKTDSIRNLLKEAGGLGSLFLRTDPSPWTGALLPDGAAVEHALDIVKSLATNTWPAWQESLDSLTGSIDFRRPTTLKDAEQLYSLLSALQETARHYGGDLYRQDLKALSICLGRGAGGRFAAFWAWCTNADFRQARRTILSLRSGKASVSKMLAELKAADAELQDRHRWASGSTTPRDVPSFSTHRQKFDDLISDIARIEPMFPGRDFRQISISQLSSQLEELRKDQLSPRKIPRLWEIERGLDRAGLEKFVKELRSRKPRPDIWVSLFDYAWFSSCLDAAMAEDPEIAGFNGRTHSDFVREFAELDKERIRIASARVRRAFAERAISSMNAHPDQEFILRGEAQKKRRHMPLRALFEVAKDVVTSVSPCWMASPLSVSQLLTAAKCFDFVIFDEASQVLPEDAVPAIMRASHLVVAGDSKQLPPTTFFSVGEDFDLEEEEIAAATEGYESLLDVANIFMPSWSLDWHYRSRDESLISFSNHHLYKDRLVTFPGPGGPPVIQHFLVNQPPGLDGQEESSSAEVQKVIQLVLEHAEERPDESLGVIAMGIRHADRVQRALDAALAERPDLDHFFDPGVQERFFVKNLERVQGDERDAIILTVGYGKDRGGNLLFRFGPLLSLGGQRRLNVAVTRARSRMTLVSSFSHLDMDLAKVKQGTGVELLRNYLQYAATGGKQLSDVSSTSFPMNEFESQVYDVLQSKGIPLIPQVGASRFRIDLVAQHPTQSGRFVLAIECDGASYHSSPTARDRDRLRQQQLENLGWKFHRIWSTDWYMRKEQEVDRVLAAYQNAVAFVDNQSPDSQTSNGQSRTGSARQKPGQVDSVLKRGARPSIPHRDSISQYAPRELMVLIRWINSDGQLRTDEELIKEMVQELGFSRRGGRIEEAIRQVIFALRAANLL